MDTRKTNSGETVSTWMEIAPFSPLKGSVSTTCDVCIVGAGIAGLSAAYHLAKAGKSVVVVDMGPIAGGQTGRTSAHLTWKTDELFSVFAKELGDDKARMIADSHREAINHIEEICLVEGIDCDFARVDGYLFAENVDEDSDIKDEFEALHKIGYQDVQLLDSVPNLFFETGTALRYPAQAQFHPMKYMNGLVRAIEKYGGQVFDQCSVKSIEDDPAVVQMCDGKTIQATKIIVASSSPINDRFVIHTKQAPYRTYCVGAQIPKDSVPWALYWDTEDPYHYIRVMPDENSEHFDILIVGGEDHKTGQEDDPRHCFENLKSWALNKFPMIRAFKYQWSGQIWESADGLAFIGKNPGDKNTFIVTGDSGQGLTYGTMAGMMLKEMVLGREHPWSEIYDPSRMMLGSVTEYLKENLNVAWQYTDYLKTSEVSDVNEIKCGEGAVVLQNFKKVAVYKNEHGALTEVSAVCPHLGGIVHWNSVEKSWDCPCHGSRFAVDGHVITGPALSGLEPMKYSEPYIPSPIAQKDVGLDNLQSV